MSQTFFVWPHGGKAVSLASNFNHWDPQPLVKQGNYFFIVLDLPDGTYYYKYVVDGRWVYDISQPHEDDGSGNWNNFVEVGKVEKAQAHHAPAKHEQKQHEQKQHQQQAPKEKDQQQGKGGKAGKKENPQQQQQQQSKKQQQQQKGKKQQHEHAAEPEHTAEAHHEPEHTAEAHHEPEHAAEAHHEPQHAAQPQAAAPEKKEKTPVSIITLEVVACDVDTDMDALEQFVRTIQRPGLKWEGSAVKEHVFGLKKLEIILQAQDDVAIEDDILKVLNEKEDLVGGATILNFSC